MPVNGRRSLHALAFFNDGCFVSLVGMNVRYEMHVLPMLSYYSSVNEVISASRLYILRLGCE